MGLPNQLALPRSRNRLIQLFIAVLSITLITTLTIFDIPYFKTLKRIPSFLPGYHRKFSELDVCGCYDNAPVTPSYTTIDSGSQQSILILQHFSGTYSGQAEDVQVASLAGHQRYAAAHGYRYRADNAEFFYPGDEHSIYLNKIYVILRAVLDELARGDKAADWILLTDGDTLIYNPAVPLNLLFPNSKSIPSDSNPLILGGVDMNGLNGGVMAFKPCYEIVTFLAGTIDLEREVLQNDGWSPADQWLIGTLLHKTPEISKHFYRFPLNWLNAYPDIVDRQEFYQPGVEITPVLQYHLVHNLKHDFDYRWILDFAEGKYEEAKLMGEDKEGYVGNGLDLMDEVETTKFAADKWWREAEGGVEGMGVFNR